MQETVAVKIEDGAINMDLIQGFETGVAIKCPLCDVTYRLFHRNRDASTNVMLQSMQATSFEDAIESSHPQHPVERFRLKKL